MALIDPDGLYNGRRLRKCSDRARLYWPYFFLAANGLGRIEIDPDYLIRTCFPGFEQPPSEEEVWEYFREYRDQHLIFLYGVGDQVWGQWHCKAGSLPTYTTKRDRESPSPPGKEYSAWIASYSAEPKAIPKNLGNLPKVEKKLGKFSLGVGVGVGVGKAEAAASNSKTSENSGKPPKAPLRRRRDPIAIQNIAGFLRDYSDGEMGDPDTRLVQNVHDALGDPLTEERLRKYGEFLHSKRVRGVKPQGWGLFLTWAEDLGRGADEPDQSE